MSINSVCIKAFMLLALILINFGYANANMVFNGSFEIGNFIPNWYNAPSLASGSKAISGWTVVSGEIAWSGTPNYWGSNASDGSFWLDLTGWHDSSPYGGVAQTIGLTAGNQYRLSFDLGTDQENWIESGGPVSVLVGVGGWSKSFTFNPSGNDRSTWQTFSMDFISSTDDTDLSIIGTMGKKYIGLDNVILLPTPIPGAVWLLGSGIVGLVGARKKLFK